MKHTFECQYCGSKFEKEVWSTFGDRDTVRCFVCGDKNVKELGGKRDTDIFGYNVKEGESGKKRE